MRSNHLLACSLATAVLASHGLAQLPTGNIAIAAFATSTRPGGIFHIDPATSSMVPVYGNVPQDLNSVVYDPATGDYYVGGTGSGPSPAPGEILRLSMYGSAVVQSSTHAQLPYPYNRAPAMTLDHNGNVIVAAGITSSTTSEVLRIDRQTGAIASLTPTPFSRPINALTGKEVLYIALLPTIAGQPSEIWRIGPIGSPTLIATTSGVVSGNQVISGMTLGPDSRELWVSCFGSPSLFKVMLDNTPGTSAQVVPLPIVSTSLNDVRYDEGTQRFFFCTALATGNQVWSVDATGNPASLQSVYGLLQNVGTTSQMTVGARPGEMTVFPCAVTALFPQRLHIDTCLHGLPGEGCIVYVSGLLIGNPGAYVPLASLLLSGPLQPDFLSLPPIPLGIDSSAAGATFLVGEARFDALGNLVEHEPEAAMLALVDKQDKVLLLDNDPTTVDPPFQTFGAYGPGMTLKVDNKGPNTVLLLERDFGPPPGPWQLHSTILKGGRALAQPGANQLKEYRVDVVGGPPLKAKLLYN